MAPLYLVAKNIENCDAYLGFRKEAILEEFGGIGMKKRTQKLTLSAMFLAIGMVLPFFTGQIPKIGNMLLPMHIPVLLCGFICGWFYGDRKSTRLNSSHCR